MPNRSQTQWAHHNPKQTQQPHFENTSQCTNCPMLDTFNSACNGDTTHKSCMKSFAHNNNLFPEIEE